MTTTTNTAHPALTIRTATPGDAVALNRLAQLDSAAPLDDAPVLVAAVGGELVAAVTLGSGRAIANPFRQSAGIVALLEARAAELVAPARPTTRLRLPGWLRISPVGRA